MDFMATFADLALTTYPSEFNGRIITPTSGISLVPVLKGKKSKEHDYLFFEHIGRRAVIHGDWKLVALNKAPWELYDLKNDRSEMHNLASQHPDIVKDLAEAWQHWAENNKVLPKP
jgi:arylsulfatase A-like enzyme